MTEDTFHPPVSQAEDTAAAVRAYGMLVLGLILSLIPVMLVQGLGMTLLLVGIIYTYCIKAPAESKPITHNHRRWLIRTFWLSSILFIVGMVLLGSYIASNLNPEIMEQIQVLAQAENPDMEAIISLNQQLIDENKGRVFWGTILAYGPGVIYMLARLIRGYRLLDGFKTVENVKTWLV